MMARSSLSVVCSALARYERELDESYNDPISLYYGYSPPPQPARFRTIAASYGWNLGDVINEVENRCGEYVAYKLCSFWESETV